MSGEVVVLIPSRNRPESLLKAYESVAATSNALVCAFVDKDQSGLYADLPATFVHETRPGTHKYVIDRAQDPRFVISIGDRHGPVNSINTLQRGIRGGLKHLFPEVSVFTYMTDDSTIGPPGWDRWLLDTINAFPNRIGVVSAAHSGGEAEYVNFYAISQEMLLTLGWYAWPCHAWYWDTVMELIGDATKIVYATTQQMCLDHQPQITHDSQGLPADDCRDFANWCIGPRRAIIKRVREAMVVGSDHEL